MPQNTQASQNVLPPVRCSGNLRRRTGVWLGLSAWELMTGLCVSMIPDFLYRLGILSKPNLLAGIFLSASVLGFCIWFRRNKPPNYFTLWFFHNVAHPPAWRAPKHRSKKQFPILSD